MWLFYVDEYGDDSMVVADANAPVVALKPGVSEWFVLSAVGIPAHCRLTLAEQLRLVKDRAFEDWRDEQWCDTEVKGRHLRQAVLRLQKGKGPLRPEGYKTLDLKRAELLCSDLGWLLTKFRPVIYVVAIDKTALLEKGNGYSPIGIAYAYLQQRLALLVEQVLGPSEGVLIVADEQSGHESAFRSGTFHKTRRALSKGLAKQPNFDLLLDKPVWVNAHLSDSEREIIQLADLVAYSAGRACTTGSCPEEPHYLWSEISQCMALNWRTHKIPGGGFTIYPRPKSYPTGL